MLYQQIKPSLPKNKWINLLLSACLHINSMCIKYMKSVLKKKHKNNTLYGQDILSKFNKKHNSSYTRPHRRPLVCYTKCVSKCKMLLQQLAGTFIAQIKRVVLSQAPIYRTHCKIKYQSLQTSRANVKWWQETGKAKIVVYHLTYIYINRFLCAFSE